MTPVSEPLVGAWSQKEVRAGGWSIRRQATLMLLLVVAPLIVLVAFAWYDRVRAEYRYAATAVTRLAAASAFETAQFLGLVRSTLEWLAERARPSVVDAHTCDPVFSDLRGANPRLANISVMDRAGWIVCSARPPTQGKQAFVGDRKWIQQAIADAQFKIGEPTVGRVTGRWIVAMAAPIRSERDGVIGVVAAGLDLLAWPVLAEHGHHPPGTLVMIINAAGAVVASSTKAEHWLGKNLRAADIIEQVLREREGVAESSGMDGIHRVYAFKPVTGSDWFVVAGIPSGAAYEDSRSYALWSGLIALVGTALTLLAAGFTSQRVYAITAHMVRRIALELKRVVDERAAATLGRARAENALRESEARFHSFSELSCDTYWEQDQHFRFVSPTRNDTWRGKTYWELPAARPLNATWEEHRATVRSHLPFRDFEYLQNDRDGNVTYTSTSGQPIFDGDGAFRGYRGVAKDLTACKLAEQRLAQLAQFDVLTGLPNRDLLRDRLQQTLAQTGRKQRHVGVLFLDLDRFKLVNDTLGRQKGDMLLAQVAARLGTCTRPGDTIGRISGDEFAVVLAELAHADDAVLVAQRMITAFAAPFDLGGHEAFVSATVGISVSPGDGLDPDVLLKNADVAMYRAKESGRNRYCFYTAEMNERSAAKLALNNDLRRALARDEFEVHYQPKVRLRDGQTCGMEALLRWRHPDRGMVLPGEFIAALEENGLIVPAGEWVMHTVCQQLRAWRARGLAVVPIAVNLSVRQFQQPDLEARIRSAVDHAGIEPALLELEITESELLGDPEHAIRILRNLRDAGIRISVDDFGTGYSSLTYLRRLPISALKIDRSIVQNVHQDASDAAIVRTIIDLAHNLHFAVVAEGVEIDAQAGLLRACGCEFAQGYLFGRPTGAVEAATRLACPDPAPRLV